MIQHTRTWFPYQSDSQIIAVRAANGNIYHFTITRGNKHAYTDTIHEYHRRVTVAYPFAADSERQLGSKDKMWNSCKLQQLCGEILDFQKQFLSTVTVNELWAASKCLVSGETLNSYSGAQWSE